MSIVIVFSFFNVCSNLIGNLRILNETSYTKIGKTFYIFYATIQYYQKLGIEITTTRQQTYVFKSMLEYTWE